MDEDYTDEHIRDWYAGQALIGIKSNPELLRICARRAIEGGGKQQDYVAKMAFIDAESMMAERKRRQAEDPQEGNPS
jgi:hypothetical protein